MTPFGILAALAGISHREAGELLSVRIDTVKSWSSGRNRCPSGALAELRALIARQERTAREALAMIRRGDPDELELGYPVDDEEASSLGWPCVGAWQGMAARVVAATPIPVKLVARGSTPSIGAAVAAHERSG